MVQSLLSLIEAKREELERLCILHSVRRLELFGSAAGGSFDPEHSDLDFLVEFQELPLEQYARSYFGLLFSLEGLFGRPVDLVMTSAIRNPYFLADIAESRTVLYEAA